MTKLLHRLSGFAIWVVFAAMGGALVHANIPGVTQSAFDFIPVKEWRALCFGLVLVCTALLYLITFGPRKQKVRYLSFNSESGSVSISVNAVRDYIRKLSGEFSAIVSIDPRVSAEKDQINIILNLNVVAGACIPDLSQALQERVRGSLRDGLGIEDVHEIKVRVEEITGEPRSVSRN